MRSQRGLVIFLFFIGSLVYPAERSVLASEYPSKFVNLIIPYGAGGGTDLSTRALAKAAGKYLGQPVICENKPGGGGTIGPNLVLRSKPDGYTVGIITDSPIINYHMGELNFDPVTDPTRIIRWGGFLFGILVRADSPVKSIQELVEQIKKSPQKLFYGSAGVGTPVHIAMEIFCSSAGIELGHIPYKSAPESCTALLGGHVDMISCDSSFIPLVDAGKLRLLATYGIQRADHYPQVPTTKEIYGFSFLASLGICGPKGMPQPVVNKLHDAFREATNDQEFMGLMKKLNMDHLYLNSEEYGKYVIERSDEIGKLIRKMGLNKK
jgi:tripartite-type tricarboxylate transporter receptor subunit TctC